MFKLGIIITKLILITLLITFLAFEAYYRVILFYKITENIQMAPLWIQDHTLTRSPFDDYFNRKTSQHPKGLFKVNQNFEISVVAPNQNVLNFSVRTNNYGLLSDHDYSFERNPETPEYRIVVLGDSMTGPTTSTYQWVDTVEELLNKNSILREKVGNKTFKVYNLGWVGAGFNSFYEAYETSGKYFNPDLILLNYIEIDFSRDGSREFSSDEQKINNANTYIEKINQYGKKMLITLMPIYNDMIPFNTEFVLTKKLIQTNPTIAVEIMRDYLPTNLGQSEIESWFNTPIDAHCSDKGGEIYARALAKVIAKRMFDTEIDFSKTETKHSKEVLGVGTPSTRKIETKTSRVAKDETVLFLKDYIKKGLIKAKVFSVYPYTLRILQGENGVSSPHTTPLAYIPYSKTLVSGFVKIVYGTSPQDVVFLNMSCTSKPISLSNPDCYTHLHMYVE